MPTDNKGKTDLRLSKKIDNLKAEILDQLKNAKGLTEFEREEIKLTGEGYCIVNAYSLIIKDPGLEKHIIKDLLNKDRAFKKEVWDIIIRYSSFPLLNISFSVDSVSDSPREFEIILVEYSYYYLSADIDKEKIDNLKAKILDQLKNAKALTESERKEIKLTDEDYYISRAYPFRIKDSGVKKKKIEDLFIFNKDRSFKKKLCYSIPHPYDPLLNIFFSVQLVSDSPREFEISLIEYSYLWADIDKEKIDNLKAEIINQLKNAKALTEFEREEIKLEDEDYYISKAYSLIIKDPGLEKKKIEDLFNKSKFKSNLIPKYKLEKLEIEKLLSSLIVQPYNDGEFKIILYEKEHKIELLLTLFEKIMWEAEARDYKALDQSSLEEFKSNPQVPDRNYIDSGYELIVQDDRLKNKFSENIFNEETINSIFRPLSSTGTLYFRIFKSVLLEVLEKDNKLKELDKIDKLATIYVKIINKDEGKITINLFHTKTKKKERIASIIQKKLLDNGPIDKGKLAELKRASDKEYQSLVDLDPNFKEEEYYHIAHEGLLDYSFNEFPFYTGIHKYFLFPFIEELLKEEDFKNSLIKKVNEERRNFGLDLLPLDKTTKIELRPLPNSKSIFKSLETVFIKEHEKRFKDKLSLDSFMSNTRQYASVYDIANEKKDPEVFNLHFDIFNTTKDPLEAIETHILDVGYSILKEKTFIKPLSDEDLEYLKNKGLIKNDADEAIGIKIKVIDKRLAIGRSLENYFNTDNLKSIFENIKFKNKVIYLLNEIMRRLHKPAKDVFHEDSSSLHFRNLNNKEGSFEFMLYNIKPYEPEESY